METIVNKSGVRTVRKQQVLPHVGSDKRRSEITNSKRNECFHERQDIAKAEIILKK